MKGIDSWTMKLAIISGTSINLSDVFADWEFESIHTPFGVIEIKRKGQLVVVNRHGFSNPMPPHASNYRGYVSALKTLGVGAALIVSSVGSLREELLPGSLVSCGDYVSFAPATMIDDRPSGFAPRLDNSLLGDLVELSPEKIVVDRIYAQTRGPRFETRAEVRILQTLGCDVVGMTLGNEADLLLESGISVTSLCMVDNFAHGIGEEKLTMDGFHVSVGENQEKVDGLLGTFVARFGK
ncbi:MAG: MTAP family purine nucleoside phosphorylase [Opitutales bacterium]|jgi:5'-methylthioadenosine phosphorylase|nr:MTAP family purine nucleoside phosphorylase [Opitutales bacterium]MBT5169971.1 MTAP family purine nucleoside phosphorylase [Opitutales bacterium]MBT5816040.1 MTAP family purine nucleoside phosphorylase [Opitutales bacterium]MBT6767636.1 MTAP family purine nucleoside phosphorylase [Opitutales bacterium]MBT7866428.1 MTAP family purine nucleoside phosphorylase [Opitutales bacterium]